MSTRMPLTNWMRIGLLMLGLFALGLATAAYLRPEFIIDLGNRIMLCF